MPALVKDSSIRGVGLLVLMLTGLGGSSHYLECLQIHGSFKITALRTADQRKHAHQKGEGSTCHPAVRQSRALHCALSIVFLTSSPDDKLVSIIPLPIQAHFTVQEGHAWNPLSIT